MQRASKNARHRVIIALAPNGAYRQKSDHPALPLTREELVQTARDAARAGATLLHLHIRDRNQHHSLDAERYRRTIDAIREETGNGLIIQITSESAGIFSPDEQAATIRQVNPEAVSIALRELVPDKNSLIAAQRLFHWCAEQRCRAQFILYSEADLQAYLSYRARDVIPSAPHSLLFVLGRYAKHQASSIDDLDPFLRYRDQLAVPWMVCAFGASEQSCLLAAARRGGHVRTGFENNLLTTRGQLARDNIAQIADLIAMTRKSGLPTATIEQARQILSIRPA